MPLCPNPDCELTWHDFAENRCPGSGVQGPMLESSFNRPQYSILTDTSPWIAIGDCASMYVGPVDGYIRSFVEDEIFDHRAWEKTNTTLYAGFDPKAFTGFDPKAFIRSWFEVEAEKNSTIKNRALPKPSTVPPMWANNPSKSHRQRNHENHRTSRQR